MSKRRVKSQKITLSDEWVLERRSDKVRKYDNGPWVERWYLLMWHKHVGNEDHRLDHEALCLHMTRWEAEPWVCGRCDTRVPDEVLGYYKLATWALSSTEK